MGKLYIKLAATNMKNSRQFYLPYLLTGMLCVLMFYSVLGIEQNPALNEISGGTDIKSILFFGVWVVGFFSCIFLFYTNSFIIKRRKKEFGIYNILGMEKRHIAKVMLLETLFLAVVVIAGGLAGGIVFNKLFTMFLYRLTGLSASIPFYISWAGLRQTALLFGLIFAVTLLYNFLQIKLANPMELLHSDKAGEREPKTKILMSLAGILCIGAGYYIALTEKNPVRAIELFFVAVILVIIGTYFIFTAGSIAFLKLLRRNKKYYYKTRHFTAVSGMLYRMKQNAVGLANICILSTMVLVMLSCTVSMYFGVEDELDYRYPTEISVVAYYTGAVPEDNGLYDTTVSAVKEAGGIMTSASSMDTFGVVAYLNGTEIVLERQSVDAAASLETMYLVNFCTAEDYEAMTGENVALLPGEIAVAFAPFYGENEITIGSKTYAVKENLSYEKLEYYMITGGEGYVITGDKETFYSIYHELDEYYQNASAYAFTINQEIAVDLAGTTEEKLAVEKKVGAAVTAWKDTEHEKYEKADSGISFDSVDYETKQENRESFYSLYGSLFFLGLFLGILFLMITVLIIFYKQISEGYEDRERFAIMEKVGMSSAEVKASINSQIRLVFFLPLVTAAIHLAAAFPMLKRILAMLNLTNTALFVWCLAGTVVVFGVIYFIVFAATSKTYYRIVGNQA